MRVIFVGKFEYYCRVWVSLLIGHARFPLDGGGLRYEKINRHDTS